MRSPWITQLGLKSNDKCPCKKWGDDPGGPGHVKTEANWGDTARSPGIPGAPEAGGSRKDPPWSLRRARGPAPPWISDSGPPEPGERNACRLGFVVICPGSRGTAVQPSRAGPKCTACGMWGLEQRVPPW